MRRPASRHCYNVITKVEHMNQAIWADQFGSRKKEHGQQIQFLIQQNNWQNLQKPASEKQGTFKL